MRRLIPASLLGLLLFVQVPESVSAPVPTAPGNTARISFGKKIGFSLLQDYAKGEDLEQVRRDFRSMKELGITTWRGSFSWIDLEPEPGEFDFSWLRRFLDVAAQEGITLRPYLGYTPSWAAGETAGSETWNLPPRRLDDWRGFVSRVVTETRGYRNIASFEIYNEENTRQWWGGSPEDYNRVLKTAAVTVKTEIPAMQVIFGGMVYPDVRWLEAACVTAGNARAFDILPFHAYPETWTPKEITVENYLDQGYPGFFRGSFIPAVDTKCAGQPIWINEAGFATAPGKTEEDQANWWGRALATFLADPRIEHLGIYQLRDRKKSESVIGEPENYYLGIIRSDGKEKLAFRLLKRLVPLLDAGLLIVADAELTTVVTGGSSGELYAHLFVRPDGRQLLFVWDRTGNPTLRLHPRPGERVVEYRLDGTEAPFADYDGTFLHNVQLKAGTVRVFEVKPRF